MDDTSAIPPTVQKYKNVSMQDKPHSFSPVEVMMSHVQNWGISLSL